MPTTAKREIFEPEHEDFRESVRRFIAEEIAPNHAQWEQDHVVSRDLFTKMAEKGMLALDIPEEYGGQGIDDWRFSAVIMEEGAYSNYGDALIAPGLHSDVVVPYLMNSADAEQRARWFPGVASGEQILAIAMTEPGTGSDLAGIKTRARRDGDAYVLDGAKTFITNGLLADLVVVAARTSDDKHGGLSLFVVERGMDGFERGKQIHKLGQHCSDTTELFFNEVRVPVENLLGAEGSGFLQLVNRLVPERLALAVSATAGCEAALAMTLSYVKERTAFGKPIGTFQNSRFLLAELKTEIEMLRCFVDRTIARYVAGTATIEEAAMCKYKASDLLNKTADIGVQLHGGYGYTTEYPIAKAFVDARIMKIYAGTNEIMKEIIGKTMGL